MKVPTGITPEDKQKKAVAQILGGALGMLMTSLQQQRLDVHLDIHTKGAALSV